MINLSLDELKLVAKSRNIKHNENKSEEDLIKILSRPKPKISIPKKKLKDIKTDFSELRHKFSKEEIDKYRKSFYNIKNPKSLSTAEIRVVEKNLAELAKSLKFNKFYGNVDSVDYDDVDNYNDNYGDAADDDKYRKIGSIRRLFEGFNKDYFKPIKTDDDSFGGNKNSYIEYKSRGDRYENLSPKEYLNMIKPYLRDLINDHKTPMKLTNKVNSNDTKFGERKHQLAMLNNCISSKNFEETRSIYSASNNIEIFMGSDTDDIIEKLFDTISRYYYKISRSKRNIK